MVFSLVSNKRLKVVLDKGDMSCYNISFSTLDYSSKENKEIFARIISRAKLETGFDTDGHKLLIEAFPNADGGAYIYITKLAVRSVCPVKKPDCNSRYILKFAEINGFIDGVRYMAKIGVRMVNLYMYADRYFAEIDLSETDEGRRRQMLLNTLEYADCVIDYKFISYLNEYGTPIKKN